MPDSGKLDDTYSTFSLGDLKLASGEILKSAEIAYKLIGPKDAPVIVYPTWFSGLISENFYWLTSSPPPIDSTTHRVLIPALFGNGQSTSPSNSSQRPFPAIHVSDNVHAQRRLLEHLGIDKILAVIGWSMGGMTSLQWAASYPDLLSSPNSGIVAICATSKCSQHNAVMLEGVKSALIAPMGASSEGAGASLHVKVEDTRKEAALKAMGRVYAGWGFSQPFYQKEEYKKLGFDTLEDWMVGFWYKWACSKEVENLLAMIQTWQNGDIASGGNLAEALNKVKVRSLILPGDLDLYFHRNDAAFDAEHIPKGELKIIPGIYGHWAGGPGGSEDDTKFVRSQIRRFLGLEREDELKVAGGREKRVEVEKMKTEIKEREGAGEPVVGGVKLGGSAPGQDESEGPLAS